MPSGAARQRKGDATHERHPVRLVHPVFHGLVDQSSVGRRARKGGREYGETLKVEDLVRDRGHRTEMARTISSRPPPCPHLNSTPSDSRRPFLYTIPAAHHAPSLWRAQTWD